MRCERIDEQRFEGLILQRIYREIARADLVICDLTGLYPNVFYETGYAHALGKRAILLIKDANEIPFDLSQYQHVVYKGSTETLRRDLEERLRANQGAESAPAGPFGSSADFEKRRPHAFALINGVSIDLGTLVGPDTIPGDGTRSVAYDINNLDQIVGGSDSRVVQGNGVDGHAFLWQDGFFVDLAALPAAMAAGWILQSALALNDNGQIVRIGMLNGERHAFLLSPVSEPAPVGLMLLGLVLVICKHRAKPG